MKRGRNIRGLSSVVTTMIIIVLSLVAIGVVWVVVKNILSQESSQIELEQFTVRLDIKNAYESSGNILVNVQREKGEGELTKAVFTLSDGTNFESVVQDCVINELFTQSFSITPTQFASTQVLTVSVAPIYKLSEGKEKTGEITDTYNIIPGSLNENLNGDSDESPNNDGSLTCTPDCGLRKCGPALNNCNGINACGNCSISTDSCINGVCVPLNCVPEPIKTTCGEQICGNKINNCGEEIDCLPGCSPGTICRSNICVEIDLIDAGLVEETWPGTSGMYFGSTDLPIDADYFGSYIKFLDSFEIRCLLIAVYRFPIEGYEKSHIGFNFQTSIQTGDAYEIYSTSEECQAA
jgi:hypothetical protein